MKARATASSISSATRSGQPNFLFGLLGREAETYADAYLISEEGKRFPIVRSLLAMKCDFFKEKFFPGSLERETHSDVDGPDEFMDDIDPEPIEPPQETDMVAEDKSDAEIEDPAPVQPDEPGVEDNIEVSKELAEKQDNAKIKPADPTDPIEPAEPSEPTEPTESIESPKKEQVSTVDHAQDTREITPERVTKKRSSETPILPAAANGSFQISGNMKPRYPMPFPTILLKQVVEFIYTDSVKFLDDIEASLKPWRGTQDTAASPYTQGCMVVSHIVELSRAADYVQLKELCIRCCFILRLVVKAKRSTACAALGAIRRQKDNPFFLNKMASHIVKYISGDVKKSFGVVPCTKDDVKGQEASTPCFGAFGLCTVMHLSSAALEEIICAQTRGFSDEYMLQVTYFWSTGGKRLSSLHTSVLPKLAGEAKIGNGENEAGYFDAEGELTAMDLSTIASSKQVAQSSSADKSVHPRGISLVAPKMEDPDAETRFNEGKAMTGKFNLSDMNPSFLHEYVEDSGLVDRETFYNVYRFRALSGPRFTRIFSIKKKVCPPRCDQIGGTEESSM